MQADHAAASKTWRQVADQLRPRIPKLATLMDDAEADVIAFMNYPKAHWPKLHSTNPIERLNKEVKRRADVVGIFPNEASIRRLVGAILLEQNDEWQLQHRYMTLETMANRAEEQAPPSPRSPPDPTYDATVSTQPNSTILTDVIKPPLKPSTSGPSEPASSTTDPPPLKWSSPMYGFRAWRMDRWRRRPKPEEIVSKLRQVDVSGLTGEDRCGLGSLDRGDRGHLLPVAEGVRRLEA